MTARPRSVVVQGDSRHLEALLDTHFGVGENVDLVISSPPYGPLINYGTPNQIGFGQSDLDYLADMRALLASLYRRTSPGASLWLILDSYLKRNPGGLSRLRSLPFIIGEIAEEEGWTLREVVIWRKDHTRPWTHHGKLRKAFEYILLLVKNTSFKFHVERLRDPSDLANWWVRYPERYHPHGKAPDNVWDIPIPVQGSWANTAARHACPLPVELVRRLILLSSDPGDRVLDPFAGIGTVPGVAKALGRHGLGIELNQEFVSQYTFGGLQSEIDRGVRSLDAAESAGPTPRNIVSLRALKYPKALSSKMRSAYPVLAQPRMALAIASLGDNPPDDSFIEWFFEVPGSTTDRRRAKRALDSLASRAPLSKYGIRGSIDVVSPRRMRELLQEGPWYVYEHGRTWCHGGILSGDSIMNLKESVLRGRYPAVVSNLSIRIDLDGVMLESDQVARSAGQPKAESGGH